jgi:hypothetical protein
MAKTFLKLVPIQFDRDELQGEFNILSPKLRAIILYIAWYAWNHWNIKITITSLIRLTKKSSVHYWKRGADIRVWVFNKTQREILTKHINEVFPYGDDEHDTFLIHDTGQGIHIHVQVIDA